MTSRDIGYEERLFDICEMTCMAELQRAYKKKGG